MIMTHRAIVTGAAPSPRGFYSQAVQAGPFLFISGQLPIDNAGKLVGTTPAEQTRQAMSNVRAILSAAGAAFADLVQVTVYVSDIAHWPEVNDAYQQCLGDVPVPPARAVVPVKELHYGALVEIQAIALSNRGQ